MNQGSMRIDERLTEEILNFSRHVAGSCSIGSVCVCGEYALGQASEKAVVQVLAVIHGFQPRLMNYFKVFDSTNIALLAVDAWVFERDVDRGFLGEALASGLVFPYMPLLGKDYLHAQEVKLKRRLVLELLDSLVLDYPELSYEFHIRPEYFLFETMLSRAKLFPPTLYAFLNFRRANVERGDIGQPIRGFTEALRQLEKEHLISFEHGYVRMSKEFVDSAKRRRVRFTNLFKTGQRAMFTSLLGIFPQVLNLISQNKELIMNLQKIFDESSMLERETEDPESLICIPTAGGLAPLTSRVDIQAFARKVLGAKSDAEVKIENIGGILNDVYLVRVLVDRSLKRAVVKRFRDWSSFKWFPLTLWSVGTKTFTVLGISRLERECGINELLRSNGFTVPRILYVNLSERLVFMEYIEGEVLSRLIKEIANSKSSEQINNGLKTVTRVGELFSKIHALGVSLGDTKPENLMIDRQGKIFMVDFEQASRDGDKVWDIAEFLYYAGHDFSPFADVELVQRLTEAFVKGYLKSGGNASLVKKAASPKYTKVFSVFTFPNLMYAIASVCRRADKLELQYGET